MNTMTRVGKKKTTVRCERFIDRQQCRKKARHLIQYDVYNIYSTEIATGNQQRHTCNEHLEFFKYMSGFKKIKKLQ